MTWSNQILDYTNRNLSKLQKPFKYIVTCFIQQNADLNFTMASKCANNRPSGCALRQQHRRGAECLEGNKRYLHNGYSVRDANLKFTHDIINLILQSPAQHHQPLFISIYIVNASLLSNHALAISTFFICFCSLF